MASENYLIIMIDSFGLVLFCVALYFGIKNYKKHERSKVLWALFNIAMGVGIAMALFITLEWMDFYPLVMDQIENALTLVFTVILFAFTLVEKEENKLRTL